MRCFTGLFHTSHRPSRRSVPVSTYRLVCKNVLILRNSYSFRKFSSQLSHLFRVPYLVCCDHFNPFIHTQHPQKCMSPPIRTQIPLSCFFQKRRRRLSRRAQLRQHFFFVREQTVV